MTQGWEIFVTVMYILSGIGFVVAFYLLCWSIEDFIKKKKGLDSKLEEMEDEYFGNKHKDK